MGNGDLEEKKLLGSGGYAIAKLTKQQESRANVGVSQIFLANVGIRKSPLVIRVITDSSKRFKRPVGFSALRCRAAEK
jgi:hypothetical protein